MILTFQSSRYYERGCLRLVTSSALLRLCTTLEYALDKVVHVQLFPYRGVAHMGLAQHLMQINLPF